MSQSLHYPPMSPGSSQFSQTLRFSEPEWRLDPQTRARLTYASSFFLFGLINNVLYVVILSAALDLVDKQSTPKGLILLFNITPALLVKVGWPYFVKGTVQYRRRIFSCSLLSFGGIIFVAMAPSLWYRLCGISAASFSSGLGEMTFLQLATSYGSLPVETLVSRDGSRTVDLGGVAVGWFSSGTGAAGLVGAALWWLLRGLGVTTGLGLCSFLSLGMAFTYIFVLPSQSAFLSLFQQYDHILDHEDDSDTSDDDSDNDAAEVKQEEHLTTQEKFQLAKPLITKYMLPLFFVYLAEYTINSGISPTLLYPIPKSSWLLSLFIKSLRDYYPLYALIYQLFVFLSRSSISIFRIPPFPERLLPLPTILQCGILLILFLESWKGIFENTVFIENGALYAVIGLVAIEGLCGGSAYVNVFWRLGIASDEDQQNDSDAENSDFEDRTLVRPEQKSQLRMAREKEFRIAAVGFADTLGIVCASLVSSILEPALCNAQAARGKTLCKEI